MFLTKVVEKNQTTRYLNYFFLPKIAPFMR